MVIISKAILNQFCKEHADATEALENWYRIARKANWGSFKEIKQTFNSVDYVGEDRYVFNIKGNHYRVVALVFFSVRTVYLKFIGTHAEYSKIDVLTVDDK